MAQRLSSKSKKAGPNIIRGFRRELTYFEVPVRSDIPKSSYADRGAIKEVFNEVDEEAIAQLASERENSTNHDGQKDSTVSDDFVETIYGHCSSKIPIRSYGKLNYNVNAYYGGCTALYFVSNASGNNKNETCVELLLVRSGFDCNHVEVSPIASSQDGYFNPANSHYVDEEGTFIGDCQYGNNYLMLLTNDCCYGNLRNGIYIESQNKKVLLQLPIPVCEEDSCGLTLILCSGSDGVKCYNAVYILRTGVSNTKFESKLVSGEDKFIFDIGESHIVTVHGPPNSRYGIFHNANNPTSKQNHVLVTQTQCLTGKQTLLTRLPEQCTLVVLCSNSYGVEDCTISSVYFLAINNQKLEDVQEVAGSFGTDCKKSNVWKFEIEDGELMVIGPNEPCKYSVLSNVKASKVDLISCITQDGCLATVEPTRTTGNVKVTMEEVVGHVNKSSTIRIMLDHNFVHTISIDELTYRDGEYTFSYQWQENEKYVGYHKVRIFVIRKNLNTDEDVFIELPGSPCSLTRQKPGVVYALNCAGPAYQDLNDIVYSSEHLQFANFDNKFLSGMQSKAVGSVKTQTILPTSMLNSHDGFLYSVSRSAYTELKSEQRFKYKVNGIPNGSYKLRLHLVDVPEDMTFNGRPISKDIQEKIEAMKKPGDFVGPTCYCVDINVDINSNFLQIESESKDVHRHADQICAFALLDMTYSDKIVTESQRKQEYIERQKVIDKIPPLTTINTRKNMSIVGWSQNLLHNPTGENGDLTFWKTEGDIKVCDGGYDTDTCFVTSHIWGCKYQEVNLLDYFTEEYLDTSPGIMVLEDYKEGDFGGGNYCFTAQLLSADRKVLKEYTTGEVGPLYYLHSEWEEANIIFSDYGSGVRFVAFSSKGKDSKSRAGFFGPYISGAEVRVKKKYTQAEHDSYADIPQMDKAVSKSAAERLVSKVLTDNAALMEQFIKEDDVTDLPKVKSFKALEDEIGQESKWATLKRFLTKQKLEKKREIRVFVSSTFKDFAKERDEIIKTAFSEIRRFCTERGVFFTYVDLRWGITSEQTSDGKTIAICLQEIDRCRPFFICLMGERYGWSQRKEAPDEVLNSTFDYAIESYPNLKWIDEFRYGSSVTQLEVLQGVLNNPNVSKDKCFFYMREPPSKEKVSSLEYKNLSSESEWHHQQQERLKTQVKEHPLGLNITTFKSAIEVANIIKRDLEQCINIDFPKGTELTQLERMREAHNAFGEARQRVYIGRQDYFKNITEARDKGITKPFIILGESGSGKSSLIANWAKKIEDAEATTFVFVHFIGSSADSSDYIKLIRRLFEEMNIFYDFDMQIPTSDSLLINDIGKWLRMAGSRTKVVIVLDALNQLDDGTGEDGSEHDLMWIPDELPSNVFMLCSTLPGRAMQSCLRNKWPNMKVEPLQESQKMQIITDYLQGVYGKTLNSEQKIMLVNAQQTSNPLYLKSLLDEIRIFGSFRQLTDKIKEYLSARNPQELFAKILERLEHDFETGTNPRKYLVRDATTALWCSNRGMSESELIELLDIPSAIWSPFYLSLYENLVNRNGILNFFHDHLRQAVAKKYHSTKEDKIEGYSRLADYFSSKETSNRTVEEMPFLLLKAKKMDRLKATVSDFDVFYRLADDEDGIFELIKAWRKLGGYSLAEEAYMSELLKIPKTTIRDDMKYYCKLFSLLGNFFQTLGLTHAAKKVYKTLVKQLELSYDETHDTIVYSAYGQSWKYRCNHPEVIKALQNLGTVYTQLGRYDKAISVYKDAICRQNKIETPSQKIQVCDGLLGLATLYFYKDNMLEAKKLTTRALELATNVIGRKHHFVSDIYTKLGQLNYEQHRLDEALPYYVQDLKVTRSEVGTNHPYTANVLNEIGLVYDDKNHQIAGELFEEALRIFLDAYGNNYLVTGVIRFNLGAFYYGDNHFAKAKYQFEEAYRIHVMFLGENHPDTIRVKGALDLVK
ncbi:uncharacterized protein LOC134699089 isoform X1 [Mytilus trossulus]|uniref:uncharacterized protein LOC134699089 isoform X1 n=1 Tax=Mytilus trossulus TaxID=6551 RepID=UPI003007A4E4